MLAVLEQRLQSQAQALLTQAGVAVAVLQGVLGRRQMAVLAVRVEEGLVGLQMLRLERQEQPTLAAAAAAALLVTLMALAAMAVQEL